MNAAAHALEAANQAGGDILTIKPMILPAYTAATLAAGGVADLFSHVFTGKGILAQVVPDLSPWAQFGIGGIFLLGFIFAVKILLGYHDARIEEWKARCLAQNEEWKARWQNEHEEKKLVIARLKEMQDARDKELAELRRIQTK